MIDDARDDEFPCRGCDSEDDRCRRDGCKECCFCKRTLLRAVKHADLAQVVRVEEEGLDLFLVVVSPTAPRVVVCREPFSVEKRESLLQRAEALRETIRALLDGRGWS